MEFRKSHKLEQKVFRVFPLNKLKRACLSVLKLLLVEKVMQLIYHQIASISHFSSSGIYVSRTSAIEEFSAKLALRRSQRTLIPFTSYDMSPLAISSFKDSIKIGIRQSEKICPLTILPCSTSNCTSMSAQSNLCSNEFEKSGVCPNLQSH